MCMLEMAFACGFHVGMIFLIEMLSDSFLFLFLFN